MSRGIIWMVWGENEKVRAALPRSIDSLKKYHPELDHKVLWMPDKSDLRCKSRMFDLAPFDQTLYLDADTVVLGKLDFGFEKAHQHGIAVAVNVSPWANRYAGLVGRGDIVEYDTGCVFFSKSRAGVPAVFNAWKACDLDSSSQFLSATGPARMPTNDQCGFAHAIDSTGFNPFVLPLNWNLHPKWQKTVFGPVKIWHDYNDPPPMMDKWNAEQGVPGGVMKCGQIA